MDYLCRKVTYGKSSRGQGQFGNPEEEKYLPLKANIKQWLMNTEKILRVLQLCDL
jgi:hypothetical protein